VLAGNLLLVVAAVTWALYSVLTGLAGHRRVRKSGYAPPQTRP
jgi:hypothetical protein